MQVRPVSVAEFFERQEAPGLVAAYADECAILGLPAPQPARELYEVLESSGAAHILGAFDGERMVGFAVLLVHPNPHYSVVLGVTESLFVEPGADGRPLLQALRQTAREHGARALLLSAPKGGRFERLLNLKGEAVPVSSVYCEVLA